MYSSAVTTEACNRFEGGCVFTGMSRPVIAALLSFVIPGVGQIYNGEILRGVFWLIVTPGLWIGSGGWLGWICHLAAAYTAYRYAMKRAGTDR